MNKNNIDNIYNDLLELSNKEHQKSLWLGGDSRHISSYVELMCRLFDDNDFDSFVDGYGQSYGGSEQKNRLSKLRELLNSYEGDGKDDKEILNDPNWDLIVNEAKEIIFKWEYA